MGIRVTQRQKLFEGTCLFEKRALLLQSELFVFLGMKECRTWRGGVPEKPFGIAMKWLCLCSEGSQACVHICFKLSWCCFFYFFLIEFNILRNAQSSLAPRHKRKKPQQHPLTLPPCASQQTFPNKCWRWQTGLGATGWRVLNCALQSPAPRKDEDGEQIMRVGFANSGHRPHLAGLGSTEKDNYRILLRDGCSAEPASC